MQKTINNQRQSQSHRCEPSLKEDNPELFHGGTTEPPTISANHTQLSGNFLSADWLRNG